MECNPHLTPTEVREQKCPIILTLGILNMASAPLATIQHRLW